MQTIRTIAADLGIQEASLQRRIQRKGLGSFKPDQELPEEVLKFLNINKTNPDKPKKESEKRKTEKVKESILIEVIQIAPLPMLGLAASYGVYFFAIQFVPWFIALIEASAFELIYIGLASMKGLSEKQKKRAAKVSKLAVVVSMIYNTLAAAIHQDTTLIEDLGPFWFWTIAVIHGAPLALLGYYIADLKFHSKK